MSKSKAQSLLQPLQLLRHEAEATSEFAATFDDPLARQSPDRLLHELRVHQIELEKRSEELRRAHTGISRDQYLRLYDFAPVGYLTLSDDGLIISANLTAASFLGVDRRKLIQHSFAGFITPEDRDQWRRHFLLAKQNGGKQVHELALCQANGFCFHAQLDFKWVIAEDAAPMLYLTITDISALKNSKLVLGKALSFQRRLLDAVPYAIVAVASDGIVTHYNGGAERMLGYAADEVIGKHFVTLLQEPFTAPGLTDAPAELTQYPEFEVMLKKVWQGDITEQECTLVRKDGSRFPALVSLIGLHDESSIPSSFLSIAIDNTERKCVERSLKIAAAAFDTHVGIIVTDEHTIILRTNPAFTQITGYSADDVIGKKPSFLRSGLYDENFYSAIWVCLRNEGYWQGEIWDKHKNGAIVPVLLTISRVTDANGRVTHYVGSLSDITALKQVEKILLDARERLEQQVASSQMELEKIKQQSEEINTALNVLLKHRKADEADAQVVLRCQIESTILPFLKKLKEASTDKNQSNLLAILESNLQELLKSYGQSASLLAVYQLLTPVEIQVASMVRQGLPTKTIASTLHISSGTVGIHRKHIRKKLGLDSKATNLSSYLLSLSE